MPGVTKFTSAPKRLTGWDIQVPAGTGGGFTILHRIPPIEFSTQTTIWVGEDEMGTDVNHWAAWDTWKKILKTPIKKNSARALTIFHPLLAGLDPPCDNVVGKARTEPLPSGDGAAIITIDYLEYKPIIIRPIKQMTGTSTNKNDPNAIYKEQVALALTEYQDPGTLTAAQRSQIGL